MGQFCWSFVSVSFRFRSNFVSVSLLSRGLSEGWRLARSPEVSKEPKTIPSFIHQISNKSMALIMPAYTAALAPSILSATQMRRFSMQLGHNPRGAKLPGRGGLN